MNENKATSMDEFEKQLKSNINQGATSLSNFEQQLKQNINPNTISNNNSKINPKKQTIKVRKNMVLSFPLKYKLVA